MSAPALDIVPAPSATAAIQARGYWAGVWRRLSRDPVTIVCALILLLIVPGGDLRALSRRRPIPTRAA